MATNSKFVWRKHYGCMTYADLYKILSDFTAAQLASPVNIYVECIDSDFHVTNIGTATDIDDKKHITPTLMVGEGD